MTTDVAKRIAENLAGVRARIAQAARESGRSESDIMLVAVTKYAEIDQVRALVDAGCRELGESRPQDLWRKAASLAQDSVAPPVRWHLVGHLQRNKVRRTLPLVGLIHSVDSVRLLESIEHVSRELARKTPILLEVNISAEAAKHGFAPGELEGVLQGMSAYRNVALQGLMAIASLEGGRDRALEDFARLRELRDRLEKNLPVGVSLTELSMGMSADFDLAIAEGATIVRVGSALFEGTLT
jgi:hypothetical protein